MININDSQHENWDEKMKFTHAEQQYKVYVPISTLTFPLTFYVQISCFPAYFHTPFTPVTITIQSLSLLPNYQLVYRPIVNPTGSFPFPLLFSLSPHNTDWKVRQRLNWWDKEFNKLIASSGQTAFNNSCNVTPLPLPPHLFLKWAISPFL